MSAPKKSVLVGMVVGSWMAYPESFSGGSEVVGWMDGRCNRRFVHATAMTTLNNCAFTKNYNKERGHSGPLMLTKAFACDSGEF